MRYSMFKFFRNLIPDNYVKGYLDGYTDAEKEFLEMSDYAITGYNNGYSDGYKDANMKLMEAYASVPQDLDIAYWEGYNNAMIDVFDDWEEMSTNDDIK